MHLQQYLQDLDRVHKCTTNNTTSVPPTTGEVLASYVCMPDLSGEPALTDADGLVLLTGTDRPTLNCAYEPVLASTDGPVFTDTDGPVLAGTDRPAFIGTDGPKPTSNSGHVILHQSGTCACWHRRTGIHWHRWTYAHFQFRTCDITSEIPIINLTQTFLSQFCKLFL